MLFPTGVPQKWYPKEQKTITYLPRSWHFSLRLLFSLLFFSPLGACLPCQAVSNFNCIDFSCFSSGETSEENKGKPFPFSPREKSKKKQHLLICGNETKLFSPPQCWDYLQSWWCKYTSEPSDPTAANPRKINFVSHVDQNVGGGTGTCQICPLVVLIAEFRHFLSECRVVHV